MMIENNLKKILGEISSGNNLGEKITLVGATKFVDVDKINEAISLGLTHIGENHAQELRDKFTSYKPVYKHFIGRLQQNKLKYVVGKANCIDSVDSLRLAEAIDKKSAQLGIVTDVMLEINTGENSKTGFDFENIKSAYNTVNNMKHLKIIGFMAMLPNLRDEDFLGGLCDQLRDVYDFFKAQNPNIVYLSAGMSSDYKIAINHGSNMIRLGTAIFGERDYSNK